MASPDAWRACAAGALDLSEGLLSLTRMLCAGRGVPPWHLRLKAADFADSFEDDMAYADAFRLWGMSAFDDGDQTRRELDAVARGASPGRSTSPCRSGRRGAIPLCANVT